MDYNRTTKLGQTVLTEGIRPSTSAYLDLTAFGFGEVPPFMSDVLHNQLPLDAIAHPLPGTRPLAPDDWLRRDERYAEQMALRDHLIAERRDEVIAHCPEGVAAARELLALVAEEVGGRGDTFERPDGRTIRIDADDLLGVLGQLCQ